MIPDRAHSEHLATKEYRLGFDYERVRNCLHIAGRRKL